MNSDITEVSESKPTKGQLFKKKHGISKTRKRLLKSKGLIKGTGYFNSQLLAAAQVKYRGIAKERRKEMKVTKKKKKDKVLAGRRPPKSKVVKSEKIKVSKNKK